ncbi:uncharacterized protein LOC141877335 [Acropora palmata]|uniref:uncharacterized protein LOC141877335 n=1 Tax=Acropora palmata TaxID=6131 RepID=UPI003D9FC95E
MGCSPSHAVFINSSPSQETLCLQPRIYMVSESTLCLLRDVGELRVYNVDDKDPSGALEKFEGAQDQLQNPLLFQPELRRRQRMNAEELQSIVGTSNIGEEIESKNGKENFQESTEIGTVDENQRDVIGHEVYVNPHEHMRDDLASETASSPNAHSVTVEVYSCKITGDEDLATKEAVQTTSSNDFQNKENIINEDAVDDIATSLDENRGTYENPDNLTEDSVEGGCAVQDTTVEASENRTECSKPVDDSDPLNNETHLAGVLNA